MRKVIMFIALVFASVSAFAQQWDMDDPAGTRSVSDIDYYVVNNNTALDRLLAGYRETVKISYNDAASVSVSAGEIMISNAAGSTRMMMRNTAAITSSWSVTDNGLDTGTEASATTYYVYAVADAASDETFKIRISTSSTAPTGFTYYKKLGSFYNDSSSNITQIVNDNIRQLRDKQTKTAGSTYQATTDGFVETLLYCGDGYKGHIATYSDNSSSPTTVRGYAACADCTVGNILCSASSSVAVKAGDYYKTTKTDILLSPTATVYFVPNN